MRKTRHLANVAPITKGINHPAAIPITIEQHYSTKELAKLLSISPATLDNIRLAGDGPKYIKFKDWKILYAASDVQEYLNSYRRTSTSDMGDNR